MIFSLLLRKHLNNQFGKEVTRKALKGAKPIYKDMLEKCEDIGYDNPMAGNIYMCFVFLAIWKAADGAIDYEGYRKVIKDFMTTPPVSKFMSSGDLNNPITLKKGDERMHKMQERLMKRSGSISRRCISKLLTTVMIQSGSEVYLVQCVKVWGSWTKNDVFIFKDWLVQSLFLQFFHNLWIYLPMINKRRESYGV